MEEIDRKVMVQIRELVGYGEMAELKNFQFYENWWILEEMVNFSEFLKIFVRPKTCLKHQH